MRLNYILQDGIKDVCRQQDIEHILDQSPWREPCVCIKIHDYRNDGCIDEPSIGQLEGDWNVIVSECIVILIGRQQPDYLQYAVVDQGDDQGYGYTDKIGAHWWIDVVLLDMIQDEYYQ